MVSSGNLVVHHGYIRFLILLFLQLPSSCRINAAGGHWNVLQSNIGITAMHMQLLNNDKVVIFDRTNFGLSNISLPNGRCRNNPNDLAFKVDCSAHSVEYDVSRNTVRPLMVLTDTWCSSGAVNSAGNLIQTGGWNDGSNGVRIFKPCSGGNCDWQEINNGLLRPRWYATDHKLPNGLQIIIGGRGEFNYEFYPRTAGFTNYVYFPFLQQTNDPNIENNLYPFVFLNPDGNLFVFANNRAVLLDYTRNVVVKTYPQIPGGDPRCYPSTGSAVLLPLTTLRGAATATEFLVCGGAPKGAFVSAQNGKFVTALNNCARIKITDPNPQWFMETMPMPRVMGDMSLLPNGNVLLINGASDGVAGWELGRNPVQSPVIYKPNNRAGSRFEVQTASTIPRMYHSTAVLLRDGRVLVGGSNPHAGYVFKNTLYPTELRLEAFSPSYLDPGFNNLRPNILWSPSQSQIKYNQRLHVQFTASGPVKGNLVMVTLVSPSFTTHSFSMNQRLIVLGGWSVKNVAKWTYEVEVSAPTIRNLAPSGYYLVFVVHQDIPSKGVWVHLS